MPDKKFSSLTALLQADVDIAADILPIVDASATGAAKSKKITVGDLVRAVVNLAAPGAIGDTTPAPGTFTALTAGTSFLIGTTGYLLNEAANTLAQRNGANAQAFNIYNTYTDGSNYERGRVEWSGDNFRIFAEKAGSGTVRPLCLYGANVIFGGNGSTANHWYINTSGHFLAAADNTYDIGASGATRPRNGYFSGTISSNDFSAANSFGFASKGYIVANADGVFQLWNNNTSDFGRLQFGGTTALFPALKRSSAELQARLADDSGFTSFRASTVGLGVFTVATLPAGVVGDLATVSNALAPTYGNTVIGGGAVYTVVTFDGGDWLVN